MARIVSVYRGDRRAFRVHDASYLRWLKVAEALARQGHEVDLATLEPRQLLPRVLARRHPVRMAPRLRRVPLGGVDWQEYDVVKTCFHRGFETLERRGGAGHPFIVAKLGSVVAAEDREGIYFYGKKRERLWAIQCRIAERARYVTLLSRPARDLWRESFGRDDNVLLVPGGVDRDLPLTSADDGRDPFPRDARKRCLFAGNLYSPTSQPEAHAVLVEKMNELGRRIAEHGARLYHLGTGDTGALDARFVTVLGAVDYERSWAWLLHADVGVVLSAGAFMHNNESTKIYHYLRAGLPVVSESGFPNDGAVEESGLGFVVESGRLDRFAAAIGDALSRAWDRDEGRRYVLEHHTWDRRCEVYREVLEEASRVKATAVTAAAHP